MPFSKCKALLACWLVLACMSSLSVVEGFGCCIANWVVEEVTQEVFFPLRSMTATTSVIDGIAEVSVCQFFETVTEETIGADFVVRYEIPIDKDAAVHTFVAEYDNRVIEGVVKAEEEARQEFEQAIEDGKPAFLGEETGNGIFKIEFGNVPLGVQLKVVLKYVIEVPALDANTLRFVIPSALAPELNPIAGDPQGLPFRNGVFDLTLEAFASSGSVSVSSPTHDVTVTETESGSVLVLQDIDQTRRDIVVLMETTEDIQDFSVDVYQEVLDNDEGSVLMLSLFPDLAEVTSPETQDFYIFVVDRSGSMAGPRIQQAGLALRAALEILPPSAFFNIVGFGDSFEFLFESPQSVDDPVAFAAGLAEANSIQATFGGTVIRGPLEAIFAQSLPPLTVQNLFVLTDGSNIISQNPGIIDFVEANRGTNRIFSIGIGEPDADFIEEIAEAGGGVSEIVDNSELSLIQDVMRRQVAIVSQTSFLQDIEIAWGSVGVEAPYGVTTAFSDRRVLIFYLIDGPLPESVSVTASVSGVVPVATTVSRSNFIDVSSLGQTTSVVSKMAAKVAIQDLEENASQLHAASADAQAIKDEIVRIGVKYQIASSETSFIAVDNFNWTSADATPAPVLPIAQCCGESSTARPLFQADSIGSPITPISSVGFPTKAPSSSPSSSMVPSGSPTSSPTASPVPPSTDDICFSGDNMVRLLDGSRVAIKDVRIGDIVESGHNMYSKVYGFGHRDDLHSYKYVAIDAQGLDQPLEISVDHMVFVAGRGAIPASGIQLGDELNVARGDTTTVSDIKSITRLGAYAPFTDSGTIVVNNVISSNYVSLQGSGAFVVAGVNIVSTQWLSHAMQTPRRILCRLHMESCQKETYADKGIVDWILGPYTVAKWVVEQPEWILVMLAPPVLLFAVILRLIEVLITSGGGALTSMAVLVVIRFRHNINTLKTA